MKSIVLGVSGSVACYRACDLARELVRGGNTVRACLTDSAEKFVTPALFEALTGRPCLRDAFEEPDRGRMAHIDWARQASLLVVAPATANVLNKLAAGVADDMLTTIALAFRGPTVLAPAMNPTMFEHEATKASLRTLRSRGAFIVEPKVGEVACGEQGQGKLASIAEITAVVGQVLGVAQAMSGRRVLITSGPTQEPLDDVRFISNRSSGKMGAALARAALLMGAEVTVVTGPAEAPLPEAAKIVRVRTADEMLCAALPEAGSADLIIGVAAVADFRVAKPFKGKLRRSEGVPSLDLVPNPDVVRALAQAAKPGTKVIAFAAEPDGGLDQAREKLASKGVHGIAVNDVSDSGIGFDSDDNELVFVTALAEARSGRMSKFECALWLLRQVLGG